MRNLFDSLALVVGAGGLVALTLAVVVARCWRPGLAFALDMWTAGGLLLLAGGSSAASAASRSSGPSWERIAAAAAIVAVRALVGTGRRQRDGRRGGPISGRAAEPPLAGGR